MNFTAHSHLVGRQHAFLSPSNYHWINYDEDKLTRVFNAQMAAARGTELHALAYNLIRLGVKLPDIPQSLNQYVNDAIGFRMTPEQILYYSDACWGTADCIGFRDNVLRIHDYKSGVTPASPKQLEVYAALFCMEYRFRPTEIDILLRIYQNNAVDEYVPDVDDLFHIIDKIKTFSKKVEYLREVAS